MENSYPVIPTKAGKPLRRDGMRLSSHYRRWREDFRLVRDLGLDYLRYGPPYYSTHIGPMRYDWDFADKTFNPFVPYPILAGYFILLTLAIIGLFHRASRRLNRHLPSATGRWRAKFQLVR